jgi:hypothetical protein
MAVFGRRRDRDREPESLPGGHSLSQAGRGLLFMTDPLPMEAHAEPALALGVAAFTSQMLLSGGPTGSPLLNFKAAESGVYTLNPDGTMYEKVGWGDVTRWSRDAETGVFFLSGAFVMCEFMTLKLEPMAVYVDGLSDTLSRLVAPEDTTRAT